MNRFDLGLILCFVVDDERLKDAALVFGELQLRHEILDVATRKVCLQRFSKILHAAAHVAHATALATLTALTALTALATLALATALSTRWWNGLRECDRVSRNECGADEQRRAEGDC